MWSIYRRAEEIRNSAQQSEFVRSCGEWIFQNRRYGHCAMLYEQPWCNGQRSRRHLTKPNRERHDEGEAQADRRSKRNTATFDSLRKYDPFSSRWRGYYAGITWVLSSPDRNMGARQFYECPRAGRPGY
ncbi:hypothetical protein D3C73_725570 [compost metagenome]